MTDKKNSTAAKEELRQFIERVERIELDQKALADDKKEVYAEAKGRGYDTKAMRKIVSERKRDRDEITEEEAILDLYRSVLGMVSSGAEEEDAMV